MKRYRFQGFLRYVIALMLGIVIWRRKQAVKARIRNFFASASLDPGEYSAILSQVMTLKRPLDALCLGCESDQLCALYHFTG
jgi:hypothetical protein